MDLQTSKTEITRSTEITTMSTIIHKQTGLSTSLVIVILVCAVLVLSLA